MKKQLLLGAAMLTTLGALSQQLKTQPASLISLAEKVAEKYQVRSLPAENTMEAGITLPTDKPSVNRQRSASSSNWIPFSSSMNIYGVLYADQKALQYDEDLNAVAFIQRKSPHYTLTPTPLPTSASGAIVGMYSSDWGGTWDSTLIWASDTYWGRYPQGGFYNPLGNTNILNAHLVATGPVTQSAGGWTGNYFASKKLDLPRDTVSPIPLAHRFIQSVAPPYDTIQKVYLVANDFVATDDGYVRTLGTIVNDPSSTDAAIFGFRGARIVKGSYNAGGYFEWTSDSVGLGEAGVRQDTTDGSYDAIGSLANMAWSESGQYGYVWFVGVRDGATGNNSGFQPIVRKTSDYGATWVTMPGIDFNDTAYFNKPVLYHVPRVNLPLEDTILVIPFFNFREDIAGIVDKNNKLHLVSTLWGSVKSHPDSVGWTSTFLNTDGERYTYGHVDGHRPYIYDFTEQANGKWTVTLVDSMETEAPGTRTQDNGYSTNPWDADPNNNNSKVSSAARIQLSRTPGGEYILYTWAESNSLITPSGRRWNSSPNIKVRAMDVDSAMIHPVKYDITEGVSLDISDNAQMHQVSPKSQLVNVDPFGFTVTLPVKVSNSSPLQQLQTNTHWFNAAVLAFTVIGVGIDEHGLITSQNSMIYPNPARDQATIKINLKKHTDVEIGIRNTLGQMVQTYTLSAEAGENNLTINTSGLESGIYLVQLNAGSAGITKKLIIE